MVAFCLVDRREQSFHPAPQAQPHDATDDQPMRMTTAERSFVVELVQARQTELPPGFEQMPTGGGAGLVEVLRQTRGMGEER